MKQCTHKPIAACLAFLALTCGPCLASSDAEDVLKSAAVWSFLRYSEWPQSNDKVFTVCILGRSSFAQVLRHTLEGKVVQNRPVRVVEYKSNPSCCQLIYFATPRTAEIQAVLQTAPPNVLTVGEDGHFLDFGGAVNLFIDDGHIAFESSLDVLARSGITISASLLRLGRNRDKGKGRSTR